MIFENEFCSQTKTISVGKNKVPDEIRKDKVSSAAAPFIEMLSKMMRNLVALGFSATHGWDPAIKQHVVSDSKLARE